MPQKPRKSTPTQKAVIALRRELGMTQQQLSEAMKVTVVTVCRWETVRPPSGLSLVRLADFAMESGKFQIAEVFRKTVRETQRRSYIVVPKRGMTAENVLIQLRAARGIPETERVYRTFLRAMRRALLQLMTMARSGTITLDLDWMHILLEDLEWELHAAQDLKELPNEKKQTKKR
jgi:transcriptional regulator with XRE-family HTH domain